MELNALTENFTSVEMEASGRVGGVEYYTHPFLELNWNYN